MAAPPSLPNEHLADVALLVVYGAVSGFFWWRWAVRHKAQSLGIALLPAGWFLVAVWSLNVWRPNEWIRWGGVLFGVLLLLALGRGERAELKIDKDKPL